MPAQTNVMEFSEQVLVLQVGRFREADLWVRFLSPSKGVASAFAFGGARSRRRFVGCLDLFNEILVRVRVGTGARLTLEEGVLIKGPERLRRDTARLGIARNCARYLAAVDLGQDGAGPAHALFTGILRVLEEVDNLPRLLPLFFRLRMALDQGWDVDLATCAHCGAALGRDGAHFWIEPGNLRCASCPPPGEGPGIFLGDEALATLKAVREREPARWPVTSAEAGRQCGRAIDAFIGRHVGLSWENDRFCRI